MTDQERMKEIERLIAERDKHKTTDDGGKDYSRYDEWVLALDDGGHIDWLIEQVFKWERVYKFLQEANDNFSRDERQPEWTAGFAAAIDFIDDNFHWREENDIRSNENSNG